MSAYPALPTYDQQLVSTLLLIYLLSEATSQPAYNPAYIPNQVHENYSQHANVGNVPNHYHQPEPQPAVTTIIITSIRFGVHPVQTQCPKCYQNIVTRTTAQNGILTWLLFIALAFFGFWLCCCIPFCVRSCKDIEHHCPNCMQHLGTFKRI